MIENYNITPAFSYADNTILGVSLENELIEKNYDPKKIPGVIDYLNNGKMYYNGRYI